MRVDWIAGTGYYANSYVCGKVLVDAGISPVEAGPYMDDVEFIVLTHCHYDHIAHVRELRDMCGAAVCIHGLDADGLKNAGPSLSTMFGEREPGITPDVILAEGDVIGGLEVIHTPGHTPGGICLYGADEMILFSGDTVFSDGGFGRFDFPGGRADQLKNSIEKLSGLDVEGLFPGHGNPVFSNGGRHIAAALRLIRMNTF